MKTLVTAIVTFAESCEKSHTALSILARTGAPSVDLSVHPRSIHIPALATVIVTSVEISARLVRISICTTAKASVVSVVTFARLCHIATIMLATASAIFAAKQERRAHIIMRKFAPEFARFVQNQGLMPRPTALSLAMTKNAPFAVKTVSPFLTLIPTIATKFVTNAELKGKSYIFLKLLVMRIVKLADLSEKIYLIILKTPAKENAPSADL
jgi:hypothetical protein